mmetsp:Transcript_16585/g.18773  ORF Transcript_16585/g.18773 Transcript_16585/m.18773 type:complete len:711 (+) Transcript_16585:124-2256(+)
MKTIRRQLSRRSGLLIGMVGRSSSSELSTEQPANIVPVVPKEKVEPESLSTLEKLQQIHPAFSSVIASLYDARKHPQQLSSVSLKGMLRDELGSYLFEEYILEQDENASEDIKLLNFWYEADIYRSGAEIAQGLGKLLDFALKLYYRFFAVHSEEVIQQCCDAEKWQLLKDQLDEALAEEDENELLRLYDGFRAEVYAYLNQKYFSGFDDYMVGRIGKLLNEDIKATKSFDEEGGSRLSFEDAFSVVAGRGSFASVNRESLVRRELRSPPSPIHLYEAIDGLLDFYRRRKRKNGSSLITCRGILRVPGKKARVDQAKAFYLLEFHSNRERNERDDMILDRLFDSESLNLNDVSSLLKELVGAAELLPDDLNTEIVEAFKLSPDKEGKISAICNGLEKVEPIRRDMFCRVVQFGREIAFHDYENDMNARNVAICLEPSLLPVPDDNPLNMLIGTTSRIEVLEFMFRENFGLPFTDPVDAVDDPIDKYEIDELKCAEIPRMVYDCVRFLSCDDRLSTKRLFTSSWENPEKLEEVNQELKESNGDPKYILCNLKLESVYDVSTALLHYLSNLPSPLITEEVETKLTSAYESHFKSNEGERGRLTRINEVLQEMNPKSRLILVFLLRYFSRVLSFSDENELTVASLAQTLVPFLCRVRGWWAYEDSSDAKRSIALKAKLLGDLIENASFFADFDEKLLSDEVKLRLSADTNSVL